jgi:hypothetical protein
MTRFLLVINQYAAVPSIYLDKRQEKWDILRKRVAADQLKGKANEVQRLTQ